MKRRGLGGSVDDAGGLRRRTPRYYVNDISITLIWEYYSKNIFPHVLGPQMRSVAIPVRFWTS